jgi:hypothetical protein
MSGATAALMTSSLASFDFIRLLPDRPIRGCGDFIEVGSRGAGMRAGIARRGAKELAAVLQGGKATGSRERAPDDRLRASTIRAPQAKWWARRKSPFANPCRLGS